MARHGTSTKHQTLLSSQKYWTLKMKNSVADVKILDYNLAAAYSLRITGIRRQTRIDVNQSLIHVNLFWSNFDSVFSEKKMEVIVGPNN